MGMGKAGTKIVAALAALGFAGMLAGDALAQQRRQGQDRRCAPNYLQVCQKACEARGGQVRLCPTYCLTQQREARCG